MENSVKQSFIDSEEQLHREAAEITKLQDFGDSGYLEGLRALLGALDENTRLTSAGRQFAWRQIRASLISRLYIEKGWKDYPESRNNKIVAPIIITGLPRTGTTALHKLLSVDPQFQGLERWLTHYPMPRPPRETWTTAPEYHAAVEEIAVLQNEQPKMKAGHFIVAEEVDECIEILRHTFTSNIWGSYFRVPSYDRWWKAQDELSSYRYYADVLRLIGHNNPGQQWLLKNPGHIWQMHNLLSIFPDAKVIFTHRSPRKAISSVSSLMEMAHSISEGSAADPAYAGNREVILWSEAANRAMAFREEREDQVYDVFHADFHKDPMRVVKEIYENLDLKMTEETEENMKKRATEKPELAQGVHSYKMERFDLSGEKIDKYFKGYLTRFPSLLD